MTIEKGCQKDWRDVTDDPIANTGEGWITRDDLSVIPKEAVGKFIDAILFEGSEHINVHSGSLMWTTLDLLAVDKWRLTRSPLLCEKVKAQDVHSLNRSMIRPVADGESVVKDEGQHYRYEYKGIKLDPFRICQVYNITDFGQQTLVKKSLRMGTAHKDRKQDLLDMRCCIDRMLEMMEEER